MSKRSKALKRRGIGTKVSPVVPKPWQEIKVQPLPVGYVDLNEHQKELLHKMSADFLGVKPGAITRDNMTKLT